jgi:hypothetical protein
MKKLIELDPEMRVGVNARCGGCDIDNIMVKVHSGIPNHIDWKASMRPFRTVSLDFAFLEGEERICVITT